MRARRIQLIVPWPGNTPPQFQIEDLLHPWPGRGVFLRQRTGLVHRDNSVFCPPERDENQDGQDWTRISESALTSASNCFIPTRRYPRSKQPPATKQSKGCHSSNKGWSQEIPQKFFFFPSRQVFVTFMRVMGGVGLSLVMGRRGEISGPPERNQRECKHPGASQTNRFHFAGWARAVSTKHTNGAVTWLGLATYVMSLCPESRQWDWSSRARGMTAVETQQCIKRRGSTFLNLSQSHMWSLVNSGK